MPTKFEHSFSAKIFINELEEHRKDLGDLPGWMFQGFLLYIDLTLEGGAPVTNKGPDSRMEQACNTARFAGARLTNDLKEGITHVLVGGDRSTTRALKQGISG